MTWACFWQWGQPVEMNEMAAILPLAWLRLKPLPSSSLKVNSGAGRGMVAARKAVAPASVARKSRRKRILNTSVACAGSRRV